MMQDFVAYFAALLILSGSIFGLLAAVGMVRLPDLYTRMHAASKAGVVGAGLILLGTAIASGSGAIFLRALLGIVFLAMTTPVSAHLLARAALRAGQGPSTVNNTDGNGN